MTKKHPKKAVQVVSAMRRPVSSLGSWERRLRRYIAGMAETKMMPIPPAAVAADWTVQFSLGPKGPPNQRPIRPDSGRAEEIVLRIKKQKIAWMARKNS